MPILGYFNGLGGKSVIQFDGINDYITSSDLNISVLDTMVVLIFLVAKTNNNANGRDYLFDVCIGIFEYHQQVLLHNG